MHSTAARKQSGLTLIELMISITIGLVILIAIGAAYVNSTNSTRQRETQSELNDPAANVLRQLRQDVSLAGYVDVFDLEPVSGISQAASLYVPANSTLVNLYERTGTAVLGTPLTQFFPGLYPVFGCDGAMTGTPYSISTTAGTATLSCGTGNTTRHTLQLAYQAAPGAATTPTTSLNAPNANTGEGRDCNQQSLTAPSSGGREAKFVINRYYIQANAGDGINELYCAGSGNSTAQPLARGVEEFVVRYQTAQTGTAGSAAGGSQSRYLLASEVSDTTINPLGWANVTAVEICIVSATSTTGGPAAAGTATLQTTRPTCTRGADGNFAANIARTAGDLRLWKRFTSVITVKNAIFSTPN